MQFGRSPLQGQQSFEETLRESERGDPRTCVEEIIRFRRELDVKHLVCRFSVPGIPREACATSLDLFAREVMPTLRVDES